MSVLAVLFGAPSPVIASPLRTPDWVTKENDDELIRQGVLPVEIGIARLALGPHGDRRLSRKDVARLLEQQRIAFKYQIWKGPKPSIFEGRDLKAEFDFWLGYSPRFSGRSIRRLRDFGLSGV